ncbi:hypothetical protein [Streptomyces kanamyceticus]|nr:hypothetical protein [Streptomyces kanamyceticus]
MPIDPYAALQALLRAEATRTQSPPPEKTEPHRNQPPQDHHREHPKDD